MSKPMGGIDYRCYFVTGTPLPHSPHSVVDTAVAAARGGAGVIQVRSKPITARGLYALSEEVANAVAAVNPNTRVLIDDRVDVALALRAHGVGIHGVHVGQDDLDVSDVRSLLGPDAIVGLTTGTLELVQAANRQAHYLDYLGCGPFRPTPTKDSGRPALGVSGYVPIVAASVLPVVAIGDVTVEDATQLAGTGVAGCAIVRGIMNASDPADYCARVLRAFDAGRTVRP